MPDEGADPPAGAASQTIAVLSCDAVTVRRPSRLYVADLAWLTCPARVRTLRPRFCVPDDRGVVGGDDDGRPSGLYAADDTMSAWLASVRTL